MPTDERLAIDERPFCWRCKEDFPIAADPNAGWRMGQLRPISKLPKRFRAQFRTDFERTDYACGNCYFDLTDED